MRPSPAAVPDVPGLRVAVPGLQPAARCQVTASRYRRWTPAQRADLDEAVRIGRLAYARHARKRRA